MSSKIKPEDWESALEAMRGQIIVLLDENDHAMANDINSSPVNKLKFSINGEIDMSGKVHQIEVGLSHEPVVIKHKDKRSVIGEDKDQLKLSLSGAPGMPQEPPTKKATKAKPAPEPEPEPEPPTTQPAAEEDPEDVWGSPPAVTQPTAKPETAPDKMERLTKKKKK